MSPEKRSKLDRAAVALHALDEARAAQLADISAETKVAALLAHPELGPALEREVLRRRGLLERGESEVGSAGADAADARWT